MRSERARREIEDALSMGWRIESEGPDRVVLVDRSFGTVFGHLIVALLTFWWTMGLGNLVYAAYKYVNDTRRKVVWDEPPTATEQSIQAETPE